MNQEIICDKMYGKLRTIDISDILVEQVAINQFYEYGNHLKWDDLKDMDKGMLLDDAINLLEKFNELIVIFDRVDFKCQVE